MSEQNKPPSPGLLSIISLISRMGAAAIYRILSHPFQSRKAATYTKDIIFAAVRVFISTSTIPQARYLLPTTTQTYLKWCASQNLNPILVEIPTQSPSINGTDKVHAHWIGDPSNADVVILYFHGGAYTQYGTEGIYHWWARWMKESSNSSSPEKHSRIAVLMLAYSLAPERTYPTQLKEATLALTYLLTTLQIAPENIMLGGDSAGANLAVSLLSHLLQPHPDVIPVKLTKSLRGALLFSTWLPFDTSYPSFTKNSDSDMLTVSARRWAAMFLGQSDPKDPERDPGSLVGDAYNDPLSNEANWWRGFHTVVGSVLSWRGGDEVLVDAIKELDRRMLEGWVDGGGDEKAFWSVESPKHHHIGPVAGIMMDKEKCEGQIIVEEWLGMTLEK